MKFDEIHLKLGDIQSRFYIPEGMEGGGRSPRGPPPPTHIAFWGNRKWVGGGGLPPLKMAIASGCFFKGNTSLLKETPAFLKETQAFLKETPAFLKETQAF